MKIVFISGKYSADSYEEIQDNIELARKVAVLCAQKGIGFFCPHTMTAQFSQRALGVKYSWYLELCKEYITQLCSAGLMLPKWYESYGAAYEHELMVEYHIPIFHVNNALELPQGLIRWYSRVRV